MENIKYSQLAKKCESIAFIGIAAQIAAYNKPFFDFFVASFKKFILSVRIQRGRYGYMVIDYTAYQAETVILRRTG